MRDYILIFLCVVFMVVVFYDCNVTLHNSPKIHINQRNNKNDTIYIKIDAEDIIIIDTLQNE